MPDPILSLLRKLTEREKIPLPVSAESLPEAHAAGLLREYIENLVRGAKPERAAEEVLTALVKDIARLRSIPQVNIGEGFVDFIVGVEHGSGGVVIELKPPFVKYDHTCLKRLRLKPPEVRTQIGKYLRRQEYLVLTDLDAAHLYSARDFFVTGEPFGAITFPDLLERVRDRGDLVDTMRSLEDAQEKPDLDSHFFADLTEWFHAFRNVAWRNQDQAAELVILLLNKLIFAKTLEDHGLVPYRFVQDKYEEQRDLWLTKGPHRVVRAFLEAFEPFFDEYYDTELFERRVWDELDKTDRDSLNRFCTALEFVLGIGKWDKLEQRGVVNYNYRAINEDIFGKSYEMFLAANRKDEGIYYTPASITTPMAESLVASLFGPLVDEICAAVQAEVCDFAKADALMARLARLHIIDTAAGSGGFLIKVLRAIWAQYLRIEDALAWLVKINVGGDLFDIPANLRDAARFRVNLLWSDKRQLLLSRVVRHLFGDCAGPHWMRLVVKTNFMRELVRLIPNEFYFRRFPGSQRALSELNGWSLDRENVLHEHCPVC